MKHLKIFESWHATTMAKVCPKCQGTGHIGPSKRETMENIIKNSTEKHFLEFIDDEDFVKNAADVFKEKGVFSVRTAKMLASLNLSHEEMQGIIKTTNDEIDSLEEILKKNIMPKGFLKEKEIEKLEEIVKDRAEILAALRK